MSEPNATAGIAQTGEADMAEILAVKISHGEHMITQTGGISIAAPKMSKHSGPITFHNRKTRYPRSLSGRPWGHTTKFFKQTITR